MDDLARAQAFMARLDDRSVERVVPFAHGVALFHDQLALVHDLNYLRVTERVGATALTAEAERLQATLPHRFARVCDADHGRRLAPSLRRRGWQVQRHLVMVHRREPDREPRAAAEEVSGDELVPFWEQNTRLNPWGRDEEVVRQLVEERRARERAVDVRHFAARVRGRVAASCDLHLDGGEAQVEMVQTLPSYRGRGLARAVVVAAVETAAAAGARFVFLVTDAGDWPRHLYGRLGFDPAGVYYRFVKSPA